MRLSTVLRFTLAAAPSLLSAQQPASPSASTFALIRPRFSGERAKETVAFLDQYTRWPGNRGFEASIDHVTQRLEKAGYVLQAKARPTDRLTYRVERYPMAVPAWEAVDADVRVAGISTPVLQWSTNRNMLATNSFATPALGVEAELVDIGAFTTTPLATADVKGRIVLAAG